MVRREARRRECHVKHRSGRFKRKVVATWFRRAVNSAVVCVCAWRGVWCCAWLGVKIAERRDGNARISLGANS